MSPLFPQRPPYDGRPRPSIVIRRVAVDGLALHLEYDGRLRPSIVISPVFRSKINSQ